MPRPSVPVINPVGRLLSTVGVIAVYALVSNWGYLKGNVLRLSGGGLPESPVGIVSDFAGVLSSEGIAQLSAVSTELERKTGAELRYVTVKSLAGYSKEKYANELFNKWGVGKKGKDNGVLVLVAPNEREAWIEVGYGLEAVLPDGLCGDIFRNTMRPYFKAGDYDTGVEKAAMRIASSVAGETPPAEERARSRPFGADPASPSGEKAGNGMDIKAMPLLGKLGMTAFIGVFIGIGFFMVGAGIGSRTGFPVLWGSFFGGMPLLFFSCLMFLNAAGFPFFLIHLALAISTLKLGLLVGTRHPDSFHGKSTGSSGWAWGGGGSGGFGGGGGGGFGGGSSGGGGGGGSW